MPSKARKPRAVAAKAPDADEDIVMTIASDDEVEVDDESSDEEVEATPNTTTKAQPAAEDKKEVKREKLARGFKFDDGDGHAGSAISSWDFTKAIARIDMMEDGKAMRTSVQSKIDKRRQEKGLDKTSKSKPKPAAKEESVEEEEESSDSDVDASEQSDSEDDDDENDEEENDEEDVVEEEARLQAALREQQADPSRDEEIDEIERQKAAEFFESDPFAAEEFAKTKFETFADLKLSRPLMRAISELGFTKPTPIQQRAIPVALTGKDVCASAQTGSGKTAAFLLPILERLQFRSRRAQTTRVMIICPVRELATQCQAMLEQLARFTDITCALAVGGLPLQPQEVELRNRPDVVICTPGRMIDHLRNSKSVHMDDLEILVLDEADRLLELGFTEEVLELVRMCPVARQTMLFSATMTSKVDQLIELSLKRPVRISTDPLFDMAQHLVQEFVRIRPQRESDREAILLALCSRTFRTNTIVFMETKFHAHRMMIIFGLAGLRAAELHGNLTQKERLQALQSFRDGTVDILLCTDIAARGIDVKGVHAVINYEMPKDLTTYVHRVGRTARAGRNGRAVTLTSEARRLVMKQVSRHCRGFAKSRAVPDAVIAQWKARIESMQDDIKQVMREETMEKRMREAESFATRAQNIVKYKDEIEARPARTWFMSEREKKQAAERAQEALSNPNAADPAQDSDEPQDTRTRAQKLKQMNHKKRRRFELREQEQKLLDQQAEDGTLKNSAPFASVHVAANAKHTKKSQREQARDREEASISELAERKRLKRETRLAARPARAPKSGFDMDLSARDSRPLQTPKPRTSSKDSNPFEFKERITNLKKHAKKTGSFKSKSKYKRRK